MTVEFRAWPKTPRLFRDVVITEKLDGTNACIIIRKREGDDTYDTPLGDSARAVVAHPEAVYEVSAQSRNRIISPAADNYGFATWVWDNADQLINVLGEGYHYGEWWGRGIQRGYGLSERRFSLFNTARWSTEEGIEALEKVDGLYPVPVLYHGTFSEANLRIILSQLQDFGSPATGLEFDRPEGVCVFHTQSRQVYKVLLENDAVSKTEAGG